MGISVEVIEGVARDSMTELGIVGAQIAIGQGDNLNQVSLGIANRELGLEVTHDTVFQIGSVTKVWTALLLMQLVDEGKLGLDEPVVEHLPGVSLGLPSDPWREITPRHLMSMSSGLDNGPYRDTGRGDDAVARYVDLLATVPMIFRPGTAYGYSNASTRVSGLLVERLTGKCWDDALWDRLIEPAGLRHSVSLLEQLPYHRVAVGHDASTGDIQRTWHGGRGMAPSGQTLATSAGDLVRFAQILLSGGLAGDGTRLLSESAVSLMHQPQVEVPVRDFASDWCLGPYRQISSGVEVFGHIGTALNGASILLWVPKHDVAVGITLNAPPLMSRFVDRLLPVILEAGVGLAPAPPSAALSEHFEGDSAPYTGRYESYGRVFEVDGGSDGLMLKMTSEISPGVYATGASELVPIGPHRFRAVDDVVTWSFGWDLAFTMGDEGRAVIFHNGAWAFRRV